MYDSKFISTFICWLLTNFNQSSNRDPLLKIGPKFFKSSSNRTLCEARSQSPLLCTWRCVTLYFVMVSTSLLIFCTWQCATLHFVMVSTSLLIFCTWRCATLYFVMVVTSLLFSCTWWYAALYFVMVATSLLLSCTWWCVTLYYVMVMTSLSPFHFFKRWPLFWEVIQVFQIFLFNPNEIRVSVFT